MTTKSRFLKYSSYLIYLVVIAAAAAGCSGINPPTMPYPLDFTPRVQPPYLPPTHLPPRSSEPVAATLPFQSLARSFRLGGSLPDPSVMVQLDRQAVAALEKMINQEDFEKVLGVDLQENALLAVFWGQKPFGGCSITVNRIYLAGDTLIVDVTLLEEDPEFPKIEAATSPYHLVLVDRGMFSGKASRLKLQSDGQVLATAVVP